MLFRAVIDNHEGHAVVVAADKIFDQRTGVVPIIVNRYTNTNIHQARIRGTARS